MSHKLDPKSRQNIKERRFLVVTVTRWRGAGESVTFLTFAGIRLRAREELAADDLRVGCQKSQPIGMPISYQLVLADVGKSRIELDVSRERLPSRPHQRIFDVVAN